MQFTRRDAKRRPRHWQVFGSRSSPLHGSVTAESREPRECGAKHLYAMLEAEATIAALAARLDPALGFLHVDRPDRASLSCDLMEPVRPAVDAFAFSLLQTHRFTKDDVFERHDGHCRLLPPVTRELVSTAALWAQRVWPVADAGLPRHGAPGE